MQNMNRINGPKKQLFGKNGKNGKKEAQWARLPVNFRSLQQRCTLLFSIMVA